LFAASIWSKFWDVDYTKYITVEPGKMGGKPCIRGMRFSVFDVLDYLASGMTYDEVLRDFPYLTREDIQASIAYVADLVRGTAHLES
jgi:uncharacterized protein (DUF433 family)